MLEYNFVLYFGLTEQEIDDLVAFLSRPLTDPRVVQQSAPSITRSCSCRTVTR